ncbi:DUF4150 domain-containing protein [Myxococcus virescens]|uniref:Uncharacterized protein n=1 Tax=Myxococcus virescens TaxID=83456 RepID=A0A511HPQ4_9BACT|nr:DUF4150 domain-containing protein [Myxococcus virescens]GEL75570.1 hypothetical protein MVI01_73540 [Myxococcus virescens]SDF36111.1 protein of unknown function [Myxococcus virescens]
MSKVFANGRSILHKGSGNTHTSAAPDVCKVPTPGGPVPTPFVNSAQDSMLTKGSKSVTINGQPVALTDSELSVSSGDEPGTAGGLISSKFKGKMAWGSGSVDVKIEGKGVVRFLDVTLHNGNTYNTTFISNGRTAIAYGDDTQCTACGKAVESHRVHETDEAVALSEAVFMELMKRLHEQRPLIEKYLRLREERKQANAKLEKEGQERALSAGIPQMETEVRQLQAKLNEEAANKRDLHTALTSVKNKLKETRDEVKRGMAPLQADIKATVDKLTQEMNEINARLNGMMPTLRKDAKTDTYTSGYMIGVCICKCPQKPRMLAACSGEPTTGFREAVAATPFELVEGFQMNQRQQEGLANEGRQKWECAAPQLLQAGGAGGHKVRTMSERFFTPMQRTTVGVAHQRATNNHSRRESVEFGHGETVPSCETCQKLIPEMLCENHKECA